MVPGCRPVISAFAPMPAYTDDFSTGVLCTPGQPPCSLTVVVQAARACSLWAYSKKYSVVAFSGFSSLNSTAEDGLAAISDGAPMMCGATVSVVSDACSLANGSSGGMTLSSKPASW